MRRNLCQSEVGHNHHNAEIHHPLPSPYPVRTIHPYVLYRTFRLSDEISATKDVYYAIVKHCAETEVWLRILGIHVRCLNEFVSR
jgi:hypothetical protein